MISATRLAWYQLWRQKMRLTVALSGVAFAGVLMLMQLGFQDALYSSALNVPRRLEADIVLVNPRYTFVGASGTLPRRRLYQALAVPGVRAVSPVYADTVDWKNPETGSTRRIFGIGIDPDRGGIHLPDVAPLWSRVRYPDVVLFDRLSRPEFGPIGALVASGREVVTEANRHEVTVKGVFQMGTSFGIDGTFVASDQTFLRLFPDRRSGALSLGLIRLEPGADPATVRDALARVLARDVDVLTKDTLMERELAFWSETTPIGYVFTFGVIMGVVVGSIIVYQILFADISDHLPEYATLRALGYTNGYLARVVLMESLALALLGFLPATAATLSLYRLTANATGLPMTLSADRAGLAFVLTATMCACSGLLAMRKLRRADPAEVFG